MDDELISQAEAARVLGVSRARVEQMVDAGILPAVSVQVPARKVRRSDVVALTRRERKSGWRKAAGVATEPAELRAGGDDGSAA